MIPSPHASAVVGCAMPGRDMTTEQWQRWSETPPLRFASSIGARGVDLERLVRGLRLLLALEAAESRDSPSRPE